MNWVKSNILDNKKNCYRGHAMVLYQKANTVTIGIQLTSWGHYSNNTHCILLVTSMLCNVLHILLTKLVYIIYIVCLYGIILHKSGDTHMWIIRKTFTGHLWHIIWAYLEWGSNVKNVTINYKIGLHYRERFYQVAY